MEKGIFLLGIPYSPLSKHEALERIHEIRKEFVLHPSYVSFIDTSIIVEVQDKANLEVLEVLRNAKLNLIDSSLAVLTASSMGSTYLEKLDSEDLFPLISKQFSMSGYSIFWLGSSEETVDQATQKLIVFDPLVNIVGELAPKIDIEGEELLLASPHDQIILQRIHEKNPDLLFINLDFPKQEIWVGRVQDELNIPLVIGLRNTKTSSKKNFLHQTKQNISFIIWALPLVLFYRFNQFLSYLFHRRRCLDGCLKLPLFFLSPDKSFSVIPLPCSLNQETSPFLYKHLESALDYDTIVLDGSKLKEIDLYGSYFLFKALQLCQEKKIPLFALKFSEPVKVFLKLNKLYDDLNNCFIEKSESVLSLLGSSSLFQSIYQERNTVVLSFFGNLLNKEDFDELTRKLLPILEGKKLKVDLSYVSRVESRGKSFLLNLEAKAKV